VIYVTFSDSHVAEFDADRWVLLRGVDARQVSTFTTDIELLKGDTPVAIIGAGTFFSILVKPVKP